MKTLYQSIVYTVIICMLVASCKDEKEEVIVNPSIQLSGSSSHTLDVSGGDITISFTSAKAWTARSGQNWCKVSPSSGQAGTYTLTITVDENTTYDERNTQVTVQSETVSKSITITQKQKDALTVTSNKIEIDALGGSANIEIKANVSYQSEIDQMAQSWISIASSRALTTTKVPLQIKPNEEYEKREGKISIKSGELHEVITVYQEGASPTILLSQNEYTVGSDEDTLKIQLRSNTDYQMVMPSDADWLQVIESRSFSDYTHYISVSANESYDSRSAEIQFVNKAEGVNEKVKVIQMQKDAIVVAQNEYALEAVSTELSFEIQTNVEFEVETSVEWIKYHPDSRALSPVKLDFAIGENTTTAPREGYIYISKDGLLQSIKVIQAGRVDYNQIVITHTQWELLVPHITGHYIEGIILWGDGQEEKYQPNLLHQYAEEKQHVLQLDLWGAEEMEIPAIEGIVEIDFSKF